MSTSGETAWSLTALDIVKQAMLELGVLSSGEDPDASEAADCYVRLNGMLKSWQGEANLFREATGTITIPAGSASGSLDAGIGRISSARVVLSSTNQRQMVPWNRSQYLSLPNKAASGSPTIYYAGEGIGGGTLYVWPVPTADTDIAIDYSRLAETVTDGSETLDIPEEWQEAVYLGLAARIAGMFGATRADPNTVMEVKSRAEALYQRMLDRDRPDSYYFEASDTCSC
jgi:hypothetical protein